MVRVLENAKNWEGELQSEWKGKRRGNKMAEGSGEKKEGAREKKESLFKGTGERIIREKEQE